MNDIIVFEDENNNKNISYFEDGKIVENYIQYKTDQRLEGNIYAGIIRKILPGIQAAFVDIGKSKNVFLHIKDIIPKTSNQTGNKNENLESYNINNYVKVGDKVLVQIKKDKTELKGAKASTHINFSGRYCVIIPNVDFVTVSSKIEDEQEVNRLKQIISKGNKQNLGVIVRTSAAKKTEKEILEDLDLLIKKWNEIVAKYDNLKKEDMPVLLYRNYNVLEKLILDVVDKNTLNIITNNEKIKEEIQKILDSYSLNANIKISDNIKYVNDLDKNLDKISSRKIWLKCGGFITIDKTEALTAIDVNSGKFIGEYDKEYTVYEVNCQATEEIARQIRLRDIGGIIIIDYIDMKNETRDMIINLWEKVLKKDRSKVQIVGFTPLNLLEITRKHMWS